MALVGNRSVLNKTCATFRNGTATAGAFAANTRSNYDKNGPARNRFQVFGPKTSSPDGYRPPYAFVPAQKEGGLAAFTSISGTGTVSSAGLASGKACAATLAGVGDISTANLSLIIALAATLAGTGELTPPILQMISSMAATLAGTGDISDAELGAIVQMAAGLSGTGAMTGSMVGLAILSADITPYTELSPETLAAAVWNAAASSYNDAGSMGEKLNDAGSAGNPWAALLVDNGDPGTFGERVQQLLTVAKFLGLK